MASRTTISPLAEFVRTALGVSARSSNAYRATSLTLVAWLLALEAHRLANKHGDLNIVSADTAVKDHETIETSPTSNSDVVRDSPSEDTHLEQLAKLDDQSISKLQADPNPNLNDHPGDAIGSSTDPRILAASGPENSTVPAVTVSIAPVPTFATVARALSR